MKYQSKKKFDPLVQIVAMNSMYPQFSVKKLGAYKLRFTGKLKPHRHIQAYEIEITYNGSVDPMVKILSPSIDESNPHYYKKSGSLCLYKPELFKWRKEYLVAQYIVSWTAAWIFFYEYWLQNDIWIGPEAPHNTPKENE